MKDLAVGLTGIATLQVAPAVGEVIAPDISEVSKVFVQVLIGIITLISFFRNNKK